MKLDLFLVGVILIVTVIVGCMGYEIVHIIDQSVTTSYVESIQ